MATLVVGATGATGKQLVEQLLIVREKVKVIVRSPEKVPEPWKTNEQISIIQCSVSNCTEKEMSEYIRGCHAVASCLGHNMTLKGLFGKPRKLVINAVTLLCNAVEKTAPETPVKMVLMNTSGNRNRDLIEPISIGEKVVIALLRFLLPPHLDNEEAADFLRNWVGQKNQFIEWVAVRPDSLIDDDKVTDYAIHPSPIRSAIFNAGKTSRINVGHFMANLISDADLWKKWKGQMPVIYNKSPLN